MRSRQTSQSQTGMGTSSAAYPRMSSYDNGNRAGMDASGPGAPEGPARKKLQKGVGIETTSSRRSTLGRTLPPRSMTEPQTNVLGRNRSIRDQKAPLGPRPQDFTPSKSYVFPAPSGSISGPSFTADRLASDNLYNPPHHAHVPFPPSPPNLTHDSTYNVSSPMFQLNDRSVVNKDRGDARSGSLDLVPTVNFDEFHRSIKTNNFQFGQEPPSADVDRTLSHGIGPDQQVSPRTVREATAAPTPLTARVGRSASFRRQIDTSARINQASTTPAAPVPSDSPRPVRARAEGLAMIEKRRALTHQNRKSVGPGLLDISFPGDKAPLPRHPVASTSFGNDLAQQRAQGVPDFRRSNHVGGQTEFEQPRLVVISRANRTKSFHALPGDVSGDPSKPTLTPEPPRSPSTTTGRSFAKSPAWTAANVASSAKRFSMVPAHATGLGARTISPTDARRMKRMSMLPDHPPLPDAPLTPLPDMLGARSTAHSPSLIPRKSSTPSSSRTTPDVNRRPSAAGLPALNGTPQSAVRTSTGPLPPRLSQISSSSRLPTARPGNAQRSTSTEEVPPVPAIPKAYESPRDANDKPYFGATEPVPALPNGVPSTGGFVRRPSVRKTSLEASSDACRRTGLGIEVEQKPRTASSLNKRHLQPLQLPPLNVLPLSAPTIEKLSTLQGPSAASLEGRSTPHQKRGAKTPSTPMTASKATFFSKFRTQDEPSTGFVQVRSSSSNLLRASEAASSRAVSSSGFTGQTNDMFASGPSTATPSAFSTMNSGFDMRDVQSKADIGPHAQSVAVEPRPVRVNGPRAPSFKATGGDQWPSPSSPTGAHTPSSASSLRRKWSLSFRRSSSKASNTHGENEGSQAPQLPKQDQMPPPKLPHSTTAPAAITSAPSPPAPPKSHAESRNRKSSVTGLPNGYDRVQNGNGTAQPQTRSITKKEADQRSQILETTRAAARISSIAAPSQISLSSKGSSNSMLKDQDGQLDRDDLSAEEEMRKLTARRKDFEMAAHEMDDLRRRANPKERVSPAQALRVVNLNIFERGEIVDYKDVYFCGTQSAKKHVGDLNDQATNFGYDDERGDYNIVSGDHLAYRYEIIDVLGKGSFGQVVRCVDHRSGGLVAIKIIRNKKRFHQQALIEVNILRKLREWDPHNKHGMVNFTQSFYFRGHLCISTELLGMNLYEFIKSNDFNGFSLKLIRRFTKQLLSSLVLLHSHRIIHCDLKPENVLLAHPKHSEIKVIDFGSSCFENEKVYTYIQSRFYRSPEVILGMTYGLPIDIWSLGCILAELFTGFPIFPGENEQEQLACIMEVFGPPEKHLIEKSSRKKLFFDSLGKPRLTVSSKGRRRRPSSKTLQQALKCDEDSFVDFIARCLRWDPDRRLKPEEALQHDFITGNKRPSRARNGPGATDSPVKKPNFSNATSGSRPLPDPPSTTLKHGAAVRIRDPPAGSPSKPTMARRHSTINNLQSNVGVKRTSTGAAIGSSLPRVAPRMISGKGEMATTAAAVASISQRR